MKIFLYRKSPVNMGILLAVAISWPCTVFAASHSRVEAAPPPVQVPRPTIILNHVSPEPEDDLLYEDDIAYHIPAADPADLTRLAQTVWGEARGVKSKAQQAAVIWCVFNRVDDGQWGDTIKEVCTSDQFHGYDPVNPVTDEFYDLAHDVWNRWQREKLGDWDVGRTLPPEYLYFGGSNGENRFRTEYSDYSNIWDWSWPDPYEGAQ